MTTFGAQPPHDNAKPFELARSIRAMMLGGMNNTGSVTLTAGVTTTTITDSRLTANSFVGLMPTTANAAGALATTYISARTKGSCTITHANAATLDRTFIYAILG